jgi:hypothetical protein
LVDSSPRVYGLPGIILILGLVLEEQSLLTHGPVALIVVASLGGTLFTVGILLYPYSLVGVKVEASKQ